MDLKTLNQFKSLKKMIINDGVPSSLLRAGILDLISNKLFEKSQFTINGLSRGLSHDFLDKEMTLIFNHKNEDKLNFKLASIKKNICQSLKELLSINEAAEINPKGLYNENDIDIILRWY